MGAFSSTKKTYVSSVVYNLAGPEEKRVNYRKQTLLAAALDKSPDASIATALTRGYLAGPGTRLRNYAQWGRDSGFSTLIGLVPGTLDLGVPINPALLAAAIPHAAGESVMLQKAEVGKADYAYWIDQYLADNHPEYLDTNYFYNPATAPAYIEIATPAEGPTLTFYPTGYDASARYLYAYYTLVSNSVIESTTVGSTVTLAPTDSFPSHAGWTTLSSTSTHAVYERITFLGPSTDGSRIESRREVMTQDTSGSTRTTQTTTYVISSVSWSPLKVMIYRYGSGNSALDAFFGSTQTVEDFLPFIPLRIGTQPVASTGLLSGFYPLCKKAVKKGLGAKIDDILAKIEDNPSKGDIDYGYVTFGVPLNVQDKSGKRYIYEFFLDLMARSGFVEDDLGTYTSAWNTVAAAVTAWEAWRVAQSDSTSILYGTAEPARPAYPSLNRSSVSVSSAGHPAINFDMTVSWTAVQRTTGTGQLRTGARAGDLWFEIVSQSTYEQLIMSGTAPSLQEDLAQNLVRLNHQTSANTWEYLDIYGLTHVNMIYENNFILTTAVDALTGAGDPAFMFPLHEGVLKRLPLSVSTQLSISSAYLVFNCYQTVKGTWYTSAWFKVLLVVAVIIITIATLGSGTAPAIGACTVAEGSSISALSAGGLLGANFSLGLALGASAATASTVGGIVNAVAALVLTQAISYGSTALFGDKVGAIVGAIASVIALNVGTALVSDLSLASSLSNMASAENILKLTVAAGKGYADFVKAGVSEVLGETKALSDSYNDQSKTIQAKYDEIFGGPKPINPLELGLTDTPSVFTPETPTAFFSRTLMTGGDVADMTLGMVSNFTALTLSTELPT